MSGGLGASAINYLKLCARIAPFFLVLFFVLISCFDSNVKGLFYLGFVLMLSTIVIILGKIFGSDDPSVNIHPICRVFDFPMGDGSTYNPYLNSAIISFTLAYVLMPMVSNESYNIGLLVFIASIYLVDLVMSSPIMYKCTSWTGIVFGTIIGGSVAAVVVGSIMSSKNESILYFNELKSNSVVCKRPGKQTFKCKVMKNGQVVGGFDN
jgi:hypothetical protein